MQFGHAAVVLAISSYDWNWKTFLVVGFAHFLPNFDAFPILWGWADEDFHCSITHTLLFAIVALNISYTGEDLFYLKAQIEIENALLTLFTLVENTLNHFISTA